MTAFSSVLTDMAAAFPGMVEEGTIETRVNGEASAEMRFGIAVGQGTLDNEAILLAAVADKQVGITAFRQGYVDQLELGTNGLKPNVTVGVVRKGVVWVIVEEDVTPASAVLIRCIAAGNEIAGAFRDTADASDLATATPYARYLDSSRLAQDGVTKIARLAFDFTMRGA